MKLENYRSRFNDGLAIATGSPELYFTAAAWLMLAMHIRMSLGHKNKKFDRYSVESSQDSPIGSETGFIFVGYKELNGNKVHIVYVALTKQVSLGMNVRFPQGERTRVQNENIKYMQEHPELHSFLDTANYMPITCMFHHHVNMAPFMSGSLGVHNNMYSNSNPSNDAESFLLNSSSGEAPHISLIGCISGLKDIDFSAVNSVVTNADYVKVDHGNFFMIYNSPIQQSFTYQAFAVKDPSGELTVIREENLLSYDEVEKIQDQSTLIALDLDITTKNMWGTTGIFTTNMPNIYAQQFSYATLLEVYLQLVPNSQENIYSFIGIQNGNALMDLLQQYIIETSIVFLESQVQKKAPKGGAGYNINTEELVSELLQY